MLSAGLFGLDDIIGGVTSGLGSLFGGLFGEGDGGQQNAPTPHHRQYTGPIEDLQFLSGMGRLARAGSPYPQQMMEGTGEHATAAQDMVDKITGKEKRQNYAPAAGGQRGFY